MDQQVVCANCGIAIRWQRTIVEGKSYCCWGCAQGGPCECDYGNLPPPGTTNPLVRQKDEAQEERESG